MSRCPLPVATIIAGRRFLTPIEFLSYRSRGRGSARSGIPLEATCTQTSTEAPVTESQSPCVRGGKGEMDHFEAPVDQAGQEHENSCPRQIYHGPSCFGPPSDGSLPAVAVTRCGRGVASASHDAIVEHVDSVLTCRPSGGASCVQRGACMTTLLSGPPCLSTVATWASVVVSWLSTPV